MATGRPAGQRTALLDAVRQLALAKGFPATTVDEICERAGAAKGSVYYHFGAKEELGLAALRAYFDDLGAAFASGDWASADDPIQRLRGFVAHSADVCTGPLMAHGCLLGSFTLDLAGSSEPVRQLASTMFAGLRDMVAALIADAAGHCGVTVDPAALGDHFLAVVEGALMLAKAYDEPTVPRANLRLFGHYLELLLTGQPASRPPGDRSVESRP